MKTIEINYTPYDKQRLFHECIAKYKLFSAGVGSGKTAAGANEIIKWAIKYKSTYLIMAPTNKMLKNATLAEFFKFCPKEIIKKYNRADGIIYLINGSKIICLSGETEKYIDRARGLNLGGWWIDEGSLFPAYVIDVLIGRLRETSGPLKGIITTTQKGYGWNYRYFIEGKHPITLKELPNKDDYKVFYASSHDNPYTPQEFKSSLEAQYSGPFLKQEVYGGFATFEGLVYADFSTEIHVKELDKKQKFEEVQCWIDWGFTNPMACVWVGIDNDNRVYILDEFYEKRVTMDTFLDYCKAKKGEFYNFTKFIADPSEPEHITQFDSRGMYCEPANNDILPGISKVNQYLKIRADGKPRLFVNKCCINTINEFQMYSYPNKKEGKPELEKPVKIFDHLMDTIRYGIMGLKEEEDESFVGFAR